MRLNERLIGRHGALLIVDMQEKLLARMRYRDLIVANSVRLVRARPAARPACLGYRTVSRGARPHHR